MVDKKLTREEVILTREEVIYDLENQIDYVETCIRNFNEKMNTILKNLKDLRHNQKYAD
jgi:hypothetical protein